MDWTMIFIAAIWSFFIVVWINSAQQYWKYKRMLVTLQKCPPVKLSSSEDEHHRYMQWIDDLRDGRTKKPFEFDREKNNGR